MFEAHAVAPWEGIEALSRVSPEEQIRRSKNSVGGCMKLLQALNMNTLLPSRNQLAS
jgi:hypothetical protein